MCNLPITRYRIKFKANQNIQLPAYAGSSLRGAFGHALKNIACLTAGSNQGQCKCQPVESCLYRRIFDPVKQKLDLQNRLQDVAPPFLVEAHSLATEILADQEAHFYMTLVGDFAHSQQMVIQMAWQRALGVGLGRQESTGQAQSQLLSFELCDQPTPNWQANSKLKIQFLSHVRIQHHGQILTVENFDPVIFCRSVVRRYLTLLEAYSDLNLAASAVKSLYDDVNNVRGKYCVDQVRWSRWSNRQKQKMQMDGLLGQVTLHQVSNQLADILYLGQWLHVGKGSIFGLGQYVLQHMKAEQSDA